MGMENGDIPDASIQASSEYSSLNMHAYNARLNAATGGWAAKNDIPWIQADMGYQTYLSGVITQGDGGHGGFDDWVTSFKVSTFVMSNNDPEVFVTDTNGSELVGLFLSNSS